MHQLTDVLAIDICD